MDRLGTARPDWAAISRLLAIIVICALSAVSQTGKAPPVLDVQKLMSVSEFRQAGLQKLTAEEIDALNLWLSRFAATMCASTLPITDNSTAASAPSIIESQIEGEFEGWTGDTIFKLANGQIWQQSSYAYKYHYAYRPNTLIYKAGAAYQMKVDGVDGAIQVKRLK
jgi:hypothetical protein